MKIKTKLFLTFLVMSLLVVLVVLVGTLAVERQRASPVIAATKEAEHVARILAFLISARPACPPPYRRPS